jgi:hypothetical protein
MLVQACAGLPETGVANEDTWRALMGNPAAVPADLEAFRQKLKVCQRQMTACLHS